MALRIMQAPGPRGPPMRRRLGLLSCLLSVCLPSVWACGAPASVQTGPDPACEGARSDAAAAWARVAARAEVAAAPPEHAASAAESALDRLNDHLSALRESPREVQGDEAMALSSSVMDGIDEVSGELSARVRERADDAGHRPKARAGDLHGGQGIVSVSVEPTGSLMAFSNSTGLLVRR